MNLIFNCPKQRIRLEAPEGEGLRRPALIAGALNFFDNPQAPPARSLGGELGSTLGAYAATAPMQLNLEQQYAPQYAGLDLNTLKTFLQGNDGQPGYVKMLGDVTGNLDTINTNSNTAGRASDVTDLAKLGPGARDALREANPSQAQLLDSMNNSALTELQAGRTLTPEMKTAFDQSVRAGQGARGMGYGPSDVLSESLGEQEFGDQLLQQRQRFATTMTGVNQNTTNNPIMDLLTRLRSSLGQGASVLGTGLNNGRTSGPRMFDPMNGYTSDLYNTNYNGAAAANIAGSNNRNALMGGGIGAIGSIAGAAMRA